MSVGYAGFDGLREYRSALDLYGRPLTIARANIADSLASAAVAVMGEGSESTPLAVINGAPTLFKNVLTKGVIEIAPHDDLYAPIFKEGFLHGRND